MMARADVELVTRALAPSRTAAQRLIHERRVHLDGSPITRVSAPIAPHQVLTVEAAGSEFVSRAAGKLIGALDAFAALPSGPPELAERRVLDAGASTGGFTQVALARGAASVVAVDVGHGQLDPGLRSDPRVTVLEGTNVRTMDASVVAPAPDVLLADLSFISLTLVLAPLAAVVTPDADGILLIKPQFEIGRDRLGSGGVVRSDADRADCVDRVLTAALAAGWHPWALTPSTVVGTHGNREVVAWLRRGTPVTADTPTAHEVARLACAVVAAAPGDVVDTEWIT